MIHQNILRQLESNTISERQAGIKALARSRNIQSLPLLMALLRVETDAETHALAIKAGRYIRQQNQTQGLAAHAHVPLLTHTPTPKVHLDSAPVTVLLAAPRKEPVVSLPGEPAVVPDNVSSKNDDWIYEESTAANRLDLPEVPEKPSNAPTP